MENVVGFFRWEDFGWDIFIGEHRRDVEVKLMRLRMDVAAKKKRAEYDSSRNEHRRQVRAEKKGQQAGAGGSDRV